MSTLKQLKKAYLEQDYNRRKYFFDAVKNECFHKSTDRFINSKLYKSTEPRGKAFAKLYRLDAIARARRYHSQLAGNK
ncbi:hypothetical protein [Klebsiella variicola]|uniref:hypothetical protein n=1 Tax=Klebsiella variicola TaxID=244366 RepID=UPI00109C644E|nr:hypothetical protein [Klebsiella variicola]